MNQLFMPHFDLSSIVVTRSGRVLPVHSGHSGMVFANTARQYASLYSSTYTEWPLQSGVSNDAYDSGTVLSLIHI